MALNEILGQDWEFRFNDELIGDVIDADLSMSTATVEVINDSSPNNFTEMIATRKSWDVSVSADYTAHDNDSKQASITDAGLTEEASGTMYLGKPTADQEVGDESYTGDVIITSISISKSIDDKITLDIELAGNGELIKSTKSA